MSTKKILIINGHPDPSGNHYSHALANAYQEGAQSASYEVKTLDIAQIEFPMLRSQEDFENAELPAAIVESQELIRWANHLLIVFPLWHGTTPAYFKAFIEQVFRYGFAMSNSAPGEIRMPKKLLKGRTARIVVTMGMPSLVYRCYFGGYGVKYLKYNVLGLAGIKPVRINLFGMVENSNDKDRQRHLTKMRSLGAQGS